MEEIQTSNLRGLDKDLDGVIDALDTVDNSDTDNDGFGIFTIRDSENQMEYLTAVICATKM